MRIVLYCPDRHIVYDGTTPDRTGVGGGITVRVRMAAALARRGHRVSVVCNCPRQGVYAGVRYVPLDGAREIQCDALLMHSSGGALDLTPLLALRVEAKVRVVVLSGVDLPKGSEELRPDAFYACSNFLRTAIWRYPYVARERVFVSYHGVNRWNWAGWLSPSRDAYRLIYSSHPSKGLDAAREVTRRLRQMDQRFSLHVCGGNRLWGGAEEAPPAEPGLVYGGLMNQRELASEYQRAGFLLQLQTRREPFGIAIVEAMAAGCLVLGSPVGALSELIGHGETGFLVDGDPAAPDTVARSAGLIRDVCQRPGLMEKMRRQAVRSPLDWDTVAETWEAHLGWLANSDLQGLAADWARCLECGSGCLVLADGYHCTACGYYSRGSKGTGG